MDTTQVTDRLGGRSGLGFALAFLVSTSFAVNSTSAGVAYEGGSNALSVLTLRVLAATLVLALWLAARRGPMRLPPRERYTALGLGLLLGTYSYGLLGAIEYIPVALAVLTFYTYPLLTGAAAWLMGQERVTPLAAGALGLAFVGLVLALDLPGGGVDGRGIALAAMAAVVVSALLLLSSRLIQGGDSRPVTLHMLASASAAYLLALAVTGDLALPETERGWLGFAGVPVFYTFSIIGVFAVISMIGAVRTSLGMNFEPVASMILGWLLLGQTLSPIQILGAALVLASIVVVRWQQVKAAAET